MESRYDQLSPVPPLTRITKILIITCVAIYFTDFILSHVGVTIGGLGLPDLFGLVPSRVQEDYWVWQFVTYIFLHGHHLHLLLNMLILWYFGAEIEMRLGEWGFLRYFLICGIGAGIFNFMVSSLVGDPSKMTHPIIGASGAIFGILAAYGIFYGNRYFLVFFLFPMKAKYFVLLIAGIELIMGVEANAQDNVAHFAHLGGLFVGGIYIFLKYIRPSRRSGRGPSKRDQERERLKRQFTLIVNPGDDPKDSDTRGPYWN